MNLQEAVKLYEECQASGTGSPAKCDRCPLYYCEGFDDRHIRICSHLAGAAFLLRKQDKKAEVKAK